MTNHEAYAAALTRLREVGRLTEPDLLALCEGDADRADLVAARLLERGEAAEEGFDLRFVGALPEPVRDEPEVDLFVSYAHVDDDGFGTVRALVDRFQTLQLDFEPRAPVVFYDRRDIHARHDWRHRIYEKMAEAKAMLVVLSPDYFKSDFCRAEWEMFVERERQLAHSEGAILNLYAVEVPGFKLGSGQVEGTWMEDLARRQWMTDVSGLWRLGPAMFEGDDAPPFIEKIRQELTALVEHGTRVLTSRTTVPLPSKYFVGRSLDLKALRDRLLDTRVGSLVAAQGLGGMGKSALAFTYAHAYAADYPGGRYLVPAEGRVDLVATVLSLAPDLGVEFAPEESRQSDVALRKVHAALTEKGQALLVLDNVSDPEILVPSQLARAIPAAGVHVLATSRRTPDELRLDDGACQEVGPLPDEDALALFDRYRPFVAEADPASARAAAGDLVRWVGGYTLALEVVAVHLWQHRTRGVTYPGFRDKLRREGFAELERAGEGVALTWHEDTLLSSLLAPTLDDLSGAERAVLQFAAVLPPDAVVWPWLREVVARTRPDLVPEHVEGETADPWRTVQDKLHGLRLLTPSDRDGAAPSQPRVSRMHRLVREVVRQRMGRELSAADAAAYDVVLSRASSFCRGGWIDPAHRWEITPLLETVTWLGALDDVRTADLANWLSDPCQQLGLLRQARRLMEDAVRIDLERLGPDHPNLAACYSNLANVVWAQGDLAEARELSEKAVQLQRDHLGPDHPAVAALLSTRALMVKDQGDLAEARRLLEEAIRIDRLHCDEDHPDLARSYSNLGVLALDQGVFEEARRLLGEALRIRRIHHGPDHPDLASSYTNLGVVCRVQGDLAEARRMSAEALRIQRQCFGPDHPAVATCSMNLAVIARDQGDFAEARRLLEYAIRVRRTHFGADHPGLAAALANLGLVVWDEGELVEARRLLEEAIRIHRTHFGADHPGLAQMLTNFAMVLQGEGDLAGAKRYLQDAIEIDRKHHGSDHPPLAVTYSNLATVEKSLGRLTEARRLLQDAIRIQRWHHGPDHPNLAQFYSNLATVAQDQGDSVEALHLLEEAVQVYKKNYGPDHHKLGYCYMNMGSALWDMGDVGKAAENTKVAHAIWLQSLGPGHPNTHKAWESVRACDPEWVRDVEAGRADPLEFLPRSV